MLKPAREDPKIFVQYKYMETQDLQKNNAAKFAFFYLLSLVALIFMSLSTGTIIFQIINKTIADVLNLYSGTYADEAMKFGISALVVSAPIFFFTMRQIYKSLFSGELQKDSHVRKWLTYFVMLVSSIVMIGWMIGTLNNFLSGEITLKFILKAITAISIAAAIFGFYFYDIKRGAVEGVKDKVVTVYLYASITVVLVTFIASMFFVDSPTETRKRKIDAQVLNDFEMINSNLEMYYQSLKKMPTDLNELVDEFKETGLHLKNPADDKMYEYKVIGEREYSLCANFLASNKIEENDVTMYDQSGRWPHDAGYQCISQKLMKLDEKNAAVPLKD